MSETLLIVRGITKRFDGLVATDNFDLDVYKGEIHALIGPNGAGKTTLLAQLQGELTPDCGTITLEGCEITKLSVAERARIGIARSFQISSVFPQLTVLENVALAVQAGDGHSFRFWRVASRDDRLIEPARQALGKIGLEQRADVPAAALSHGERRQLELAMAIVIKPVLLLLDEPMAGMGRQDTLRMTRIIAALKDHCTILLVEHDMDAVFALADRVTVLVAGRAIKTGNPADIRRDAEVQSVYLGHRD